MKKYFLKFFVVALAFVSLPSGAMAQQQGDVMTTFAGAQFIAGVNWGNVTATDHSITISNAHLIPDSSGGPVGFTVEWGFGSPEQNSGDYEPINITQPYILQGYGIDNYVFNIVFNNLTAAEDYYFTIREINLYEEPQPGVTDYGYNLFTYGFATTEEVEDPEINLSYSNNNTSLNVSGNLILSNGQALMAENIILQIFEVPPGTTLFEEEPPPFSALITSPIITTGGPSVANGAGYFEHTFENNVNPGSAYYLLIKRGIDQPDLVFPIYFEVPELGGGNATTTPPGSGPTFPTPPNNGLIPCNGPDCNFDMLVVLINKVVDFLIIFIAFPFVAIVMAWAGVLLLTSGGSSSAKEKSKKMIWHVVIGLILALLSWGIIKIILLTLGYQGPLLGIFGIN